MAIVRFDPFRELSLMQDRMNRMFGATSTQFGSLVFTADNGDQLFGDFSGQTELSFPNVRFYGNYQIFPTGTGRFEGVTGSGTYEGTANLILGKGTIEFNGTLVK